MMQWVFLVDKPDALPEITQWHHEQWGRHANQTVSEIREKLARFQNRNTVPLLLLAIKDGTLTGCGHLCRYEMPIYSDREYWLGGIYVKPSYRNKGIGTQIIHQLEHRAISLGVECLNLQTERLDGGLYASCGYNEVEQRFSNGVSVSVRTKLLTKVHEGMSTVEPRA